MSILRLSPLTVLSVLLLSTLTFAKKAPATAPASSDATADAVGEKVPSEDNLIPDLHSLGLIEGHTNIFRCACPVRDLGKAMTTTQPTAGDVAEARVRLQRLYDLGIRTDISFMDYKESSKEGGTATQRAINLERAAAEAVGITFINDPISNAGPHSLETMSDAEVMAIAEKESKVILDHATPTAGVAFHCSAGHDRTGLVAAYMRIKYEHWPVDQAIAEMRRYGHNWIKFSSNGGASSWHEAHLKAIATMLNTNLTQ